MVFCGQCGDKVGDGHNFCSSCGAAQGPSEAPDPKLEVHPAPPAKLSSIASRKTMESSASNQTAKSSRLGNFGGWFRALIAVAIFVSLVFWVVAVSTDGPGGTFSTDRGSETLAQEVCDSSILLGPAPSTPEGRIAWQDFGEKGDELWEMEGATELGFIGQAASQLAWATELEVSFGGGQDPEGFSLRTWWEDAGETWQTAGDYWATLCLSLD